MVRRYPPRPKDATVSIQLRLPEKLRRELAEAAKLNRRSLNSELVQRLEQSLTPDHPAGDERALRDKVVEDLIKRLRGAG